MYYVSKMHFASWSDLPKDSTLETKEERRKPQRKCRAQWVHRYT